MDRIRIIGGVPLDGVIAISGAKNAALPLMAASLLTAETLTLENVPDLADIATMANLLVQHGTAIDMAGDGGANGRRLDLSAAHITSITAPYDLVRKMRASVLVLGPLLARCGRARVSLPGGCAIGTRPIDLHIEGLRQLGAQIELREGYVDARAPKGLRGAEIVFPSVSVGATENLLMAAALAEGETVLVNAAREPEIGDLAACLQAMGARIEGIGSDRLRIVGVGRLHGATHRILPDRIETGTYMMAAAATAGEVRLTGTRLDSRRGRGERARPRRRRGDADGRDGLAVRRRNGFVAGVDITTAPYPGFPTDLQAQVMALMAIADGASTIIETIFREPLHARPRTRPHGGQHQRARRLGDGARRAAADGGAGDGDRSARLGLAGRGRPCGAGRDGDQSGLSPRPRL